MNRFLARAGVASRRAADSLIASGSVRVNGRVPPEHGIMIEPGVDEVTVSGRRVDAVVERQYLAVHKPADTVVTARDPQGRRTVFDLVREAGSARLFAVGRLDVATTGLLLLTDDGDLANGLAHPGHRVPKEYVAIVVGTPGERDLRALREGVELEDGRTLPAQAELLAVGRGLSRVRIVIREGRNRQVRRMLEMIGHPVRELSRTGFGPLRLGRLRPGGWRRLRPPELAALRAAAGLDAPRTGDGVLSSGPDHASGAGGPIR